MYKYYQLNLFQVLIGKFLPKLPFGLHLVLLEPNKEQTWENVVLKSWELYYIDSMYNYLQLTLFLVLMGKFGKS